MIKKLKVIERQVGSLYDLKNIKTEEIFATNEQLHNKINELVDAVNKLQNKKDTKKEPIDRYTKQRKWVGKLCKFEGENYGILKEIGCSDTKQVWRDGAFRSSDGYWYDFCEPVKPDSELIYHGE